MEKGLIITPAKCIGCRTCELSCSFAHADGNKLAESRVKVFPTKPEKFVPYLCLQCVDAACKKVCPTEAIYENLETGAICINEDRCIKCGSCQAACPFGNIFISRKDKGVFKCDLCGGDPKCAQFCPTAAIKYNR